MKVCKRHGSKVCVFALACQKKIAFLFCMQVQFGYTDVVNTVL